MQGRQKWTRQQKYFKVGSVVLMVNEGMPRCKWSRALIVETHPSDDGLVCKVTLKTSNSEYECPIHMTVLLYRLGFPAMDPAERLYCSMNLGVMEYGLL